MTLDPLLQAPLVIQAHAFGAMAALLLGIVQYAAPKGTLPHRTIGSLWMLIMLMVAVTAIFIRRPTEPGDPIWAGFTPIHLFVPLTLFGLASATQLLLRGGPALKHHAKPLTGVFIGGLIVAGALAFLPGRIMHRVMFGG